MNWYITVLKKYTVFSGRARRQEFWTFWLINWLIGSVINIITGSSLNGEIVEWLLINEHFGEFLISAHLGEFLSSELWRETLGGILGEIWRISLSNKLWVFGIIISSIYSLLIFIPSLAVMVRRLHDTGRSAWWLLTLVIAWGFAAISMAIVFNSMWTNVGALVLAGIFMLFSVLLFIAMFAFLVQDSQAGKNLYGPNPKEKKVAQEEISPDNMG